MRTDLLLLALIGLVSCAGMPKTEKFTGCIVQGPEDLIPPQLKSIRLGMSRAELTQLLGPEDYSPVEGQYYFLTGGRCPMKVLGEGGPCAIVTEFRIEAQGTAQQVETLQSCWWGAVGE